MGRLIRFLFVISIIGFVIATQHETPLDPLINPSNGTAIEDITVPILVAYIACILTWRTNGGLI